MEIQIETYGGSIYLLTLIPIDQGWWTEHWLLLFWVELCIPSPGIREGSRWEETGRRLGQWEALHLHKTHWSLLRTSTTIAAYARHRAQKIAVSHPKPIQEGHCENEKGKRKCQLPQLWAWHTENAQRIPTGIALVWGYYVDLHPSSLKIWSRRRAGIFFPLLDHLRLGAVSAFGGIQDHGLLTALKWHPWACPWDSVHSHCSFLMENP